MEDYVRAIYHYQRYLELRSDTEKKQMVEDMIMWAKVSFAAGFAENPSTDLQHIATLQKKNKMLQAHIEDLEKRIRDLEGNSSTATPASPGTGSAIDLPAPRAVKPGERSYTVRQGDTLSSIAKSMYNNSAKWKDIYEANKKTMKDPKTLREGQVLVIP